MKLLGSECKIVLISQFFLEFYCSVKRDVWLSEVRWSVYSAIILFTIAQQCMENPENAYNYEDGSNKQCMHYIVSNFIYLCTSQRHYI